MSTSKLKILALIIPTSIAIVISILYFTKYNTSTIVNKSELINTTDESNVSQNVLNERITISNRTPLDIIKSNIQPEESTDSHDIFQTNTYYKERYDNFNINLSNAPELPEIPDTLLMEIYSDISNNNPSEPSNDLLHFEIFKIFYNWEEEKNKLITINKNELNSFLPFDDYFIFPIGNINNTDSLKLTNIGKFYPELYKRKEPEYFPEDLKCTRLFVINKNSDSIYFSAIKEEIILIEEPESDKYYVINNNLGNYKSEYNIKVRKAVKSASKEELLKRINSGYIYTRSFWEPDQLWDYYLHSTGVDWKQEDGSDIEIQDVLFDVIDISRGNTNGADVLILTSEVYIDGEFLTYANLYVPIANWGDQNLTENI